MNTKPISNPKIYKPVRTSKKIILFLGYGKDRTSLIDALLSCNCEVHHSECSIPDIRYDLVICFGYRRIIQASQIKRIGCPIINLHISYLPYNRGAHPNFWSFFEGTPAGVTIHLIDKGIDTGPILFQKRVIFDPSEITFAQTYKRLIFEIEALFISRLQQIIECSWTEKKQVNAGTQHNLSDLPVDFAGWDSIIAEEIRRLQDTSGTPNA